VPQVLIDQLKVGGILVAPVGPDAISCVERNYQQLTKIIRTQEGLVHETLLPVVFVPMVAGMP
jgi:protein-L-isoaspartate(D-aspartate) O-methyltransferase